MFPFDYIPQTIDPTLRKFIIFLICLQFTAFVLFCFNLIQDHKKKKREAANTNLEETSNSEDNTNTKDTIEKPNIRESSSERKSVNRKKMD